MVEGHPLFFLLSVTASEGRQVWFYTQRPKTHGVYPHREMDGDQPHLGLALWWIWLWVWLMTALQKEHGNIHFVQSRKTKVRPQLRVNKSTSRGSFLTWRVNSLMGSWALNWNQKQQQQQQKLPIPPNLSHFLSALQTLDILWATHPSEQCQLWWAYS